MNRVPIRWRLTILSALVMTLVLVLAAVVLYVRFSADIRAAIDAGLRSRAETVAAGMGEPGINFGDGGLVEADQAFSQILAPTDRSSIRALPLKIMRCSHQKLPRSSADRRSWTRLSR